MDSLEGGHRGGATTCCATCYAWATFLISTALIFLLLFGIILFALLSSNLPEVKVHRLDVYKLNLTQRQLAIDVQVMVNVTNNSNKTTLVYGKLNVETMVEGISLPDGFRQNAMTTNDLKIHPKETSSALVNDGDAKQLKLTADHHEMVMNLKMIV